MLFFTVAGKTGGKFVPVHFRTVKVTSARCAGPLPRVWFSMGASFYWLSLAWMLGGATAPWSTLSPSEREQAIEQNAPLPLPERLLKVSERFLGTPYVRSPLGEGEGIDPDPVFRLDAADCVTFVEETMAMALAKKGTEVEPLLEQLRYQGAPIYGNRNHLMEAQWLPNNVRNGFLKDVTAYYGRGSEKRVVKKITDATWKTRSGKGLRLSKGDQKTGTFALSLLSLEDFAKLVPRVASGTVVVVVREDLSYVITRISHLGFLVHKNDRPYIRHAAPVRKAVVDEPLASFLRRNGAQQNWKVEGVALYRVRDPGP